MSSGKINKLTQYVYVEARPKRKDKILRMRESPRVFSTQGKNGHWIAQIFVVGSGFTYVRVCYLQMPFGGVTVKDVDSHEFVKAFAQWLKK